MFPLPCRVFRHKASVGPAYLVSVPRPATLFRPNLPPAPPQKSFIVDPPVRLRSKHLYTVVAPRGTRPSWGPRWFQLKPNPFHFK